MRCENRRVLITGASSGIGAACARQFAAAGADVLLCARRQQRLQQLEGELKQQYQVEVHSLTLDVTDIEAVKQAWQQLPEQWQAIDILVNNAGIALGLDPLQDGSPNDWDQMIDTNIKGVLYLTHTVIQSMLKRQQGHVINLGSIAGYDVYPGGAVYAATKFAMRALSDGLKMDVHGTPIRVTLINPGMVETEFSRVRFGGDQQKSAQLYQGMMPLGADDVADAILYCATRPAHVDVRNMTIMPTEQTSVFMLQRDAVTEEA